MTLAYLLDGRKSTVARPSPLLVWRSRVFDRVRPPPVDACSKDQLVGDVHEKPVPLLRQVRESLHRHEQPVSEVGPHGEVEEREVRQEITSGPDEEHAPYHVDDEQHRGDVARSTATPNAIP